MAFFEAQKTDEKLTREMLDELPNKYQKSVGFFAWDFFRAISKVLIQVWDKLNYMANLDDLRNMKLEDLIRFVKQRRGIEFKNATMAKGQIQITNGTGTIIKGDVFETPDGTQFQAAETKQVTTNDFVALECLQTGMAGNVPENTITVIPTTIAGIVSVTNPEAFTLGYEAETKDELYQRYIDDLQKPITSGNIYHYQKWAQEIAGVKKADVKPLWNGDNTVKVLIVDQNSQPADADLIKQVQDYIDPYIGQEDGTKKGWGCGNGQAPIGAYCTVVSATALALIITVSVKIKAGETLANVQNRCENALNQLLAGLVFNNDLDYVSYARVGAAILGVEGVADYDDLLINNGADNITIPNTSTDRSVAILETLTLTEIQEQDNTNVV